MEAGRLRVIRLGSILDTSAVPSQLPCDRGRFRSRAQSGPIHVSLGVFCFYFYSGGLCLQMCVSSIQRGQVRVCVSPCNLYALSGGFCFFCALPFHACPRQTFLIGRFCCSAADVLREIGVAGSSTRLTTKFVNRADWMGTRRGRLFLLQLGMTFFSFGSCPFTFSIAFFVIFFLDQLFVLILFSQSCAVGAIKRLNEYEGSK